MDAHIYKQLISTKVQSQFIGETRAFLTNGARTIGYLHTKKKKKRISIRNLHHIQKLSQKTQTLLKEINVYRTEREFAPRSEALIW